MSGVHRAWRILCGVAAAVLVAGHTLALVGGALNRLIAGPEYNTIDRVAGNLLTATGTIQRWNMFSPNVGDGSFCPIVVLTIDDPAAAGGKREVILQSPSTPPMLTLTDEHYMRRDLPVDDRRMEWLGHFGDSRRRKLDSRVIDPVAGEWEQGTTYARWMLRRYMHENPDIAPHIRKADAYVALVRHYGRPPLPLREDCYLVRVYPQTDPLWPPSVSTSILIEPPPRKPRVYQ